MIDINKVEHIAQLNLPSSDYADLEGYEKDLERLAENIQVFVNESNYLDKNKEYEPDTDAHLSRLQRAERAIEELTNVCAYRVCHLLFV